MMKPFKSRKRFAQDEEGSITIEFVIWVPILMLWLIGSLAFFDGYRERGRAAKASHVISDILSRQVEVSQDYVDELGELLDELLPGTPAGKWIRVTSITYSGGVYSVQWSSVTGDGAPMTNDDIPLDMMPTMAANDTVVVTETHVPFTPMLDWVGMDSNVWESFLPNRPRFVASVKFVD